MKKPGRPNTLRYAGGLSQEGAAHPRAAEFHTPPQWIYSAQEKGPPPAIRRNERPVPTDRPPLYTLLGNISKSPREGPAFGALRKANFLFFKKTRLWLRVYFAFVWV